MDMHFEEIKRSGSKETKRRKIRCLQDFDNMNRSSLSVEQLKNASILESKTKKQQKFDFLPKVKFNNEATKENSPLCSPAKVKKTVKKL